MDQSEVATDLLGSPSPRLPGDDRSRWQWRGDRTAVALLVEPVVPPLASGARRNFGVESIPGEDESRASRGQSSPCGRVAVLVRQDVGDMLRDPQGGRGVVDVCSNRGYRAHEQRRGTSVAPRRDLAP